MVAGGPPALPCSGPSYAQAAHTGEEEALPLTLGRAVAGMWRELLLAVFQSSADGDDQK